MDGTRLSNLGRAVADPNRAEILTVLTSGTAHTAGELAQHIGRAASTTSRHLAELVDAGLVAVEPAGRHRYFRLASAEVADLLEHIDQLELAEVNPPARPNPGSALARARTCYDHLAGELGVELHDQLTERGRIERTGAETRLTPAGHQHLQSMGIDTAALTAHQRPLVRSCVDWTQRTHHLGGSVGAALLNHMIEREWIRRARDQRVVTVTPAGHEAIQLHFGIGDLGIRSSPR